MAVSYTHLDVYKRQVSDLLTQERSYIGGTYVISATRNIGTITSIGIGVGWFPLIINNTLVPNRVSEPLTVHAKSKDRSQISKNIRIYSVVTTYIIIRRTIDLFSIFNPEFIFKRTFYFLRALSFCVWFVS